jgi:hypothetical protein
MLRNFAAVLLATTLIAGPAFAAQSSGGAGATPAAVPSASQSVTKQAHRTKPSKMVKRVRAHAHKHFARGKVGKMTLARHFKSTKTHRGHVAHIAKPVKVTFGANATSVKTARLPATQSVNR